jgi:hypothetical protein
VTADSEAARPFRRLGTVAGRAQAGADGATARLRALKLLDISVFRQAAVLAYNHVFSLVVLLFVIGLPLVLFLKAPRHDVEVELAGE